MIPKLVYVPLGLIPLLMHGCREWPGLLSFAIPVRKKKFKKVRSKPRHQKREREDRGLAPPPPLTAPSRASAFFLFSKQACRDLASFRQRMTKKADSARFRPRVVIGRGEHDVKMGGEGKHSETGKRSTGHKLKVKS